MNRCAPRVRDVHLSTARRRARLDLLVAELALRDMNHADVARFLPCSLSAARAYMHDLLDAAVVSLAFSSMGKVNMDSAIYRLCANRLIVKDLLDSRVYDRISSRANLQREAAPGTRHVHILSDDVKFDVKICNFPVRRDPLVAALFGERVAKGECARRDGGPAPDESL